MDAEGDDHCFAATALKAMAINWEVYEKAEDKDGVKKWSLFILIKGEQPSNSTARPFKHGHWFFGHDDGDPGGLWLYEKGLKQATAEVERLNRLLGEPSNQ